MGSLSFKNSEDYYLLGLWLADGYWWSSSIGLSSTNEVYISRFRLFLKRLSPEHEIKEHVYRPKKGEKRKLVAKHVYINSRPLTRAFMELKVKDNLNIPKKYLPAYFAGRIDGDGHVDKKHGKGIRIAYTTRRDALRDMKLLKMLCKEPVSLYRYHQANTWVLYFRKDFMDIVQPKLAKYAYKLKDFCPVETEVAKGLATENQNIRSD